MTYPRVDTDESGYHAAIRYSDIDGWPTFIFPGSYPEFADAAARARKLARALREAGELGLSAHVASCGKRPAGFPRNGVTL